MFNKKCKSLPQLPFQRNYRKLKKSDHLHYYPNYHFHIPSNQQKHLQNQTSAKRRNGSATCDNVHHSTSSNSANWRLNNANNEATLTSLKHHDSDLSLQSLQSSLSNHSNLSSISVNSSNFCNNSSQLNTTSGIPSSYSSSAPGAGHLSSAAAAITNQTLAHNHALYYPGRLDKYRQTLNRSNCTNHSSNLNTSQCKSNQYSGDYACLPTPPPLPRYSSYNSISSQPFNLRSNLTTPIAGSLHLTASQISLQFNDWYNHLQINQEEQHKNSA